MDDLIFSVMAPESARAQLMPLIQVFESRYRIKVKLQTLDWVTGWADLVKMAMYGYGPDVSEIGSTWVGSIASMNALKPFDRTDVRSFGGEQAFLHSSWQSCLMAGDDQVWAMPWLADTRLFFYRKDWFERLGIVDPRDSLSNPGKLGDTLYRLRDSGAPIPLALTIERTANILHEAASWIWSVGGEFFDPESKKILFDQPQAKLGLRTYFNLRRFLGSLHKININSSTLFAHGQAAVVIGGPWTYLNAKVGNERDLDLWGTAILPGIPFVGGSNLVIWKHSRQSSAALDLIHFLSEESNSYPAAPHSQLLPARVNVLEDLASRGDPFISMLVQSLRIGRSYPTARLWGLIEDSLIIVMAEMWNELLADQYLDIDVSLAKHLDPLARRLASTLNL